MGSMGTISTCRCPLRRQYMYMYGIHPRKLNAKSFIQRWMPTRSAPRLIEGQCRREASVIARKIKSSAPGRAIGSDDPAALS